MGAINIIDQEPGITHDINTHAPDWGGLQTPTARFLVDQDEQTTPVRTNEAHDCNQPH